MLYSLYFYILCFSWYFISHIVGQINLECIKRTTQYWSDLQRSMIICIWEWIAKYSSINWRTTSSKYMKRIRQDRGNKSIGSFSDNFFISAVSRRRSKGTSLCHNAVGFHPLKFLPLHKHNISHGILKKSYVSWNLSNIVYSARAQDCPQEMERN